MNEFSPKEFKVIALRECPVPVGMPTQSKPPPPIRLLKIEADGDAWKGLIKPKIRLTGRWLERAGFSPGSHVHVTCVAPGIIELRSSDNTAINEAKPTPSEPSEDPF